jgi:hypothetical protein
MSWNYRVLKKKNESGEYEFGIYEVYYDDNGNIRGSTEMPLTPTCASEDDLLHELTIMMEALKKDTLDYNNT